MGEIAEMMLDGTLCAGCGGLLIDGPDDEPQGFPGYCSKQCARDSGAEPAGDAPGGSPNARRARRRDARRMDPRRTFPCASCTRLFTSVIAAEHHARDKHGQGK